MKNMIIEQISTVSRHLNLNAQTYLNGDYSQEGDYEGDWEALLLNQIDDLQSQAESLRELRK